MALTERLAIILESVGSSAVVKDFTKVSGAAQGLGITTDKTAGALRGLGPVGAQAGAMMSSGLIGGAAAAGAALVAFGVKSVDTFVNLGQEVLKFQRASGATAEQASALVAAFDDVGISAETGSKAIFQLGKRIGESGDGLEKYGISAVRGADGNVDLAQTLKGVADAYVNTEDPAARAQLVAAAFGKTGQDLIPILERGAAGIDDLYDSAAQTGQILSQEEVQKAEDFRLAMDDLGDSVRELTIATGSALVPKLTELATLMVDLINKGKELGGNPLVQIGSKIAVWVNPLTRGLQMASDALGLVDTGAADAAGSLGTFGNSAVGASTGAELLSDDLDSLEKSLLGVSSAERAVESASRAVTTAQQRVGDARGKLNDLLKEGAVDEKKVEQATRDLTSATKVHGRAVRDVADAQERVNELTAELQDLTSGKTGAEKSAEAQDDLTVAQLRQRGAVSKQQKAQQHYNEVATDATATASDLADALLDLDQANFDLRQSNDDVTDAQVALDAAQKIGAENSPEVIDKRDELTDATATLDEKTGDLATSTSDLTSKTEALKAAQAGDPVKYSTDLADARRGLADAEDTLATSRGTLAQRSYDLITAQNTLNTKIAGGGAEIDLLKGKFETLLGKHPELASFLDPLIADLDAANTKFGGVVDVLGKLGPALQQAGGLKPGVDPLIGFLAGYIAAAPKGSGNLSPLLPGHAAGGIATRATAGIFGEKGPEALIPLDRLGQYGGGGGRTVTYIINVAGSVITDRDLGRVVADAVRQNVLIGVT